LKFPITYREIRDLVRGEVLNTKAARQIMRKSGFRPGAAGGLGEVSNPDGPLLTIPPCSVGAPLDGGGPEYITYCPTDYQWAGLEGDTIELTWSTPESDQLADSPPGLEFRPFDKWYFANSNMYGTFRFVRGWRQVHSYPEATVTFGVPEVANVPASWLAQYPEINPLAVRIPMVIEYTSAIHLERLNWTEDTEFNGHYRWVPHPHIFAGVSAHNRAGDDLEGRPDVGTLSPFVANSFRDGDFQKGSAFPPFYMGTWGSVNGFVNPEIHNYANFPAITTPPPDPTGWEMSPYLLTGYDEFDAEAAWDNLLFRLDYYNSQRGATDPEVVINGSGNIEIRYDTEDASLYVDFYGCLPEDAHRAVVWCAQDWYGPTRGLEYEGISDDTEETIEVFGRVDTSFANPDRYIHTYGGNPFWGTLRALYEERSYARMGSSDWQEKTQVTEEVP
jgi:hypothetical protein